MKIPQGYKQTELGIIPEDWEIVSIGDLGHILGGGTPSTNNSQYWDGGIPWFTPSEIGKRKYVAFSCRTISDSGLHASSTNLLPKGTILLTTRASIGDSAILLHSATTNQGFQSIVVNNNSFSNEFVYYLLKKNVGAMFNLSSGSTFLEISKKKLASINITVPKSLAEQQAIAEALSDVDALIAALEKKIAKKRLIKQGAMIRLLSLGGRGKKWFNQRIKNIVSIKKGEMLNSGQYIAGNIPVIAGGKSAAGYHHVANRPANTITISASGASAGYVAFHDFPIFATDCSTIEPSKLYDIKYIYYLLSFNQSELYALQTGGAQPHVHPNDIYDLNIYYNSDIETQQKIATILSDMDKEIANLETRRDKYKLIKSGMMQKLLTGQIRLIKPQAKVIPLAPQMPATKEIPVDAHIVAGHIVYKSHQSRGWGRTKLQKSLHLIGYIMQLNLGNEYIRNTAGPDDQRLMNYIDQKFKQFRHVNIVKEKLQDGRTHYSYIPTALIQDIEIAYERYPQDVREQIDALLDKLNSMDLAGAEILSTLYAVWNNRIIKGEQITDDLLISDFYAWSKHKAEFEEARVRKTLDYMRLQNIIPTGWGKYINRK